MKIWNMYQMNYKFEMIGQGHPNWVKPKFLKQIYGYKVIKSGKTKNDTKYISSY